MVARATLSAVVVLAVSVLASGAGGANGAGEFTFYPQAGILWGDLYPNNFVDLDPGPGLRDFACGTQTYDGHTGTDSDIRSFREMDIGVPVLRKGLAAAGSTVGCTVTPSDGRRSGPTATAR